MIHSITSVLVCTAAAGALIFVGRYLLTRWFDTAMGRHAMAFMVVVLIVLSLAVVRELFGVDWAGRDLVRLVAFTLVNVVIWWRVALLFMGQRRARRDQAAALAGAMMAATETPED